MSLGREDSLTEEEEKELQKLLIPTVEIIETEPLSFALSLLNQASSVPKNKYRNINYVPVGSVMVESLFSMVGNLFDDRRLSTTPVHIEEQVFLRVNNHLWGLHSFVNIKLDLEQ